ncbi:MAG: DUF3450 domain-containing protein [Xanthomonadales bacterium]|nr:DUF3450 domain-containing protein [Xanthomonadales bacterium]
MFSSTVSFIRALAAALAILPWGSLCAQSALFSSAAQAQTQINREAQQSQTAINRLSDETDELLAEYRRVIAETETLRAYNAQVERLVVSQREERQVMERNLVELENTNRGIVPLIIEMVDMLEQIVRADVPFRQQERLERVNRLRAILDRSDVTTSEKYRQVMEAYQIEMEYGRTVEAYEAVLPDSDRTVDFLRVGRTLLIWQSLDGRDQGWFNPATRQWERLDPAYRSAIRDALRIARNQAAPDLVILPVSAPVKP